MARKKRVKIPDFGMHVEMHDPNYPGCPPFEISCRYRVPGLTMHDLMKIYEKGKNHPGNSNLSANPSEWPEVRGLNDVIDAVLQAVYGDIENKKTK